MGDDIAMPLGMDRSRHRDLAGRGWHVWWRRVVLSGLATIPLLGLLNFFGQRAYSSNAASAVVSVRIIAPDTVRGGLLFTSDIVVTPHVAIKNLTLYLGQGWFSGMTLNGVAPQPSNQSSVGQWQIWQFGNAQAGEPFRLWISWQTNPTTVGHRYEPVAVYDGNRRLLTAHHSMTIYP